eukprot:11186242-Lingulodinium_polyedra.AAC.1
MQHAAPARVSQSAKQTAAGVLGLCALQRRRLGLRRRRQGHVAQQDGCTHLGGRRVALAHADVNPAASVAHDAQSWADVL